jgi:hypothetical protein
MFGQSQPVTSVWFLPMQFYQRNVILIKRPDCCRIMIGPNLWMQQGHASDTNYLKMVPILCELHQVFCWNTRRIELHRLAILIVKVWNTDWTENTSKAHAEWHVNMVALKRRSRLVHDNSIVSILHAELTIHGKCYDLMRFLN